MGQPVVVDGLREWVQGDLLRDIPLFWAGTQDGDELTGLAGSSSVGHNWPVVAWDGLAATDGDATDELVTTQDLPGWGIITSQTCDVVATGPGARHPFVQVSPLINLEGADSNKLDAIRRLSNVDLTPVTNVPEGGDWAADLRISLPVSKAVLLRQERTHGFVQSSDGRVFAERVAAKYRRPALHDQLSENLVTGLNALIDQCRKKGQLWFESIEQFRLLVTSGDRLRPRNVSILVIAFESLTPEEQQPLRQWRQAERKRLLKACDITLDAFRFLNLDKVKVRDYRDSDWLRTPSLGQRPFW